MPIDPSLVGVFLEEKLKRKQTTNYGAIASRFGLPDLHGAWSDHPLSGLFEILDQQDANANRPFRTSAVVGLNSNTPGPGFFEALERLKGVRDPKTPKAREQVWITELNAAYGYTW